MEVKIFFKPMKSYGYYDFDPEEFAQLEKDFKEYLESDARKPAGGVYLCREYDYFGDLSESKKLLINFSDTVIH